MAATTLPQSAPTPTQPNQADRHADAQHPRLVTTRYAADYCGVSTNTIRRWIDAGDLRAYRVGPNGTRLRIDLAALQTMVVPA
jgi:excisionase family DNA binding protein